MAGLGESCSHICAVLFYLDFMVRQRLNRTVTDEKSYWAGPTIMKSIEYKEIKDIDFASPTTLQKKINGEINNDDEGYFMPGEFANLYPAAPDDEMSQFYEQLSQSGTKSSILSIISPFSKNYIPKALSKKYPTITTELYNPANLQLNYKQLLYLAMSATISCTKDQVEFLMQETKGEASSKSWYTFLAGRVTASNLYSVCHTDIAQPSISLICRLCYP